MEDQIILSVRTINDWIEELYIDMHAVDDGENEIQCAAKIEMLEMIKNYANSERF